MSDMMVAAQQAVRTAEVQALMRELSKYGLGVFVPHLHTEDGEFAPMPRDIVQLERDLRVSFVSTQDDAELANTTAVGWVWDEGKMKAVATCYCAGANHPHLHR